MIFNIIFYNNRIQIKQESYKTLYERSTLELWSFSFEMENYISLFKAFIFLCYKIAV